MKSDKNLVGDFFEGVVIRRYTIFALVLTVICCSTKPNIEDPGLANTDTISADSVLNDTAAFDPRKYPDHKQLFLNIPKFRMYYKSIVAPVSFSVATQVYSQQDTSSEVIGTLAFNTPLKPVPDSYTDSWFEIDLNNKTCYLKISDVAQYSFVSPNNKKFKYFIVSGFTKTRNYNLLYKYDLDRNVFLDTLDLQDFKPDYADQINTSKWKNVDLLLSLRYTEICEDCSDFQHYVMDANGKLETVFETSHENSEDEYEDSSYLLLPLNPDLNYIVLIESSRRGKYDDNGNPMLDKDGDPVLVWHERRTFYKWDGAKMIKQ